MLTVLSTCNSEKQGVGPGTRLLDCTDEVHDGFPLSIDKSTRENVTKFSLVYFFILCRSFMTFPIGCSD